MLLITTNATKSPCVIQAAVSEAWAAKVIVLKLVFTQLQQNNESLQGRRGLRVMALALNCFPPISKAAHKTLGLSLLLVLRGW